MSILVTGAAGFIGFHTIRRLLGRGEDVVGIDNLNDYYPVQLKLDRLGELRDIGTGSFTFVRADFTDPDALQQSLRGHEVRRIVHLGAQAGVRYSLQNPHAYAMSNVVGHLNILEYARHVGAEHLVYASSSSVYGGNERLPFCVEDRTDHPVSLYAATKKADELFSESYAHLFRLPQTGLRFFTVYGPWGRPGHGAVAVHQGGPRRPADRRQRGRRTCGATSPMSTISCTASWPRSTARRPTMAPASPGEARARIAVYNLGNNKSVELGHFIATIETACGRRALRNLKPMQQGDVRDTYADISDARRDLDYCPANLDRGGHSRLRRLVPRLSWLRRRTGVARYRADAAPTRRLVNGSPGSGIAGKASAIGQKLR